MIEESVEVALRGSNVALRLDLAPDLWTVDADHAQLVQVFSNILMNAREGMPQGGTIVIRADKVVESARHSEHAFSAEPGPYVRVSVVDSGVGIPSQNLGRIFDPYFSTKPRPSGLGLATAHSIVKNHGGFIQVASEPGRGTTMQISLPASAQQTTAEGLGPRRSKVRGSNRVLVMDDEVAVRTLAANMLDFLGYRPEVVESGRVAIERFKRALETDRPFDVVMLDLTVPGGMGARETIDQLARIDPTVKAVLVSGHAQHALTTEYQDHGFGAVIAKPFTLQELNTTLRSVLGSSAYDVH